MHPNKSKNVSTGLIKKINVKKNKGDWERNKR